MKATPFALMLLLISLASSAAADVPSPEVRLVGLVSRAGKDFAVIDTQGPRAFTSTIMEAGDSDGLVTVKSIDSIVGVVTVQRERTKEPLQLAIPRPARATAGVRPLDLHRVRLNTLLDVYQFLSARTVLRGIGLPEATVTVVSQPGASLDEALAEITATLATNGVTLQPAGAAFAAAVMNAQRESLAAIPEPPPVTLANNPSTNKPLLMAVGLIRFQQADFTMMRDFYQDLAGRTVLGPVGVPSQKYSIKNETRLTRAEAVWMMETLFRLSGLAVVPQGEKLAVMVPLERVETVPRFDPGPSLPDVASTNVGTISLSAATPAQFLDFYCHVTGRKLGSVASNVSPVRIDFQNRVPLTRREAIHAFETLAGLHGLAFVVESDQSVGLMPLAEARKRAATKQP